MAKTTVVQSFYLNTKQMDNFMKKELNMDIKTFQEKVTKIQNAMNNDEVLKKRIDNEEDGKKYDARREKYRSMLAPFKVEHYNQYMFMCRYRKLMSDLIKNETAVDKENLKNIMKSCSDTYRNNLFDSKSLKWDANEQSRRAIATFSNMMLKNDFKKMEYYGSCCNTKDPAEKVTFKKMLDMPLPKLREHTSEDISMLSTIISTLAYTLNNTESILHANSAEYKNMKAAVVSLNEYLSKNKGKDPQKIGKHLETIQAASMEYVQAKGVGTQATQFGRNRMSAVMRICEISTDYMDCFASEDRVKEIENAEIKIFGQALSNNGLNKYGNGLDARLTEENLEEDRKYREKIEAERKMQAEEAERNEMDYDDESYEM